MQALREETYRRLNALQEVDLSRDAVATRRAALPAELAAAEAAARAKHEAANALKHAIETARKDRKLVELEVSSRQQQLSRLSEQQWTLKSNEAFSAMQEEIKHVRAEVAAKEENVLELAYRDDELVRQHREAAAAAAAADDAAAARRAAGEQELSRLAREEAELSAARAAGAAEIEPALLSRYEQIRRGKGGRAVVEIKDETCQGCHMSVPPQVRVQIRQGNLVSCQSCARILF